MSKQEFLDWLDINGTGHREDRRINGIDWIFCQMCDGWIAIFEYYEGEYLPKMQARDMEHALSWCNMIECVPVPMTRI